MAALEVQCYGDLTALDPMKFLLSQARAHGDLVSGAIGGPLVVGFLTPQRNAMTLAAKDTTLSFFGVYREVFKAGVIGACRGGSGPTMASVPQFTAIGPAFLCFERFSVFGGNPIGPMFCASIIESCFSFGAQRQNAQIQFNATSPAAKRVTLHPLSQIASPGFSSHVMRNVLAMAGIRVFAPHSYGVVTQVPGICYLNESSKLVVADFASSIVAATVSMPFNHIFSWAACTPELDRMSYPQRCKAMTTWLFKHYYTQGPRLLGRDLVIRMNYTGYLFTGYRFVERMLIE